MTMFARTGRHEDEAHEVAATTAPVIEVKRLTPDGHEVAPGAVAQGFPHPWPDLRVQAIYETVEPDTFRGQILCGGIVLGETAVTDFEPDAIRMAEDLVVAAVGRLFEPRR
jgi:hypothetical protein